MTSAALAAAQAAVDAELFSDAGLLDEQHRLVAAKVKALMVGYDARWSGQEWVATAVEQTVVLPVVNPDSGRVSRTWRHAGKFDGIVEGYGKRCLLEHKSCSEEIADPSSTYWRRLAIDAQLDGYTLKAWQSGVRLDGTLYDVIRKPQIRPKRLAVKERQQIILSGSYCGHAADDASLAELSAGGEQETVELYGLRLATEVTAEPERYFQRRTIPRLDSDVLEYATELWQIGKEIQRSQLHGLHFRNSASCVTYGSPCEFLGLCSGVETLEGNDRWDTRDVVHEELEGLTGDGRDVLTHSRIKCFQACRRKHHFRYELGLRRRDEEEREALYLGRVLHLALEAWWRTNATAAQPHEGETDAANGSSCPATAAGQHAGA